MRLLRDVSPELEGLVTQGHCPPAKFPLQEVQIKTVMVPMRDGTRLATDIYLPPTLRAPVVVVRTPYGRQGGHKRSGFASGLFYFAQRGYVVVSQDCRGTGGSEPDSWDYYVFESEDSFDCVQWITGQSWYDGFIGSLGSSYAGQTQWCMATHPAMSAIVPSMSGLGFASNTAHLYMFVNAYARSQGKGKDKVPRHFTEMERAFEAETMAGGYFNEPVYPPFSKALLDAYPELQRCSLPEARQWLWARYCGMKCAERAQFIKIAVGVPNVTSVAVESLGSIFGQHVAHDALTIPGVHSRDVCTAIHAPPLLRTGWYDWCLNDALATWSAFRKEAKSGVAERARMIITPYAHNMPGYHEGGDTNPELLRPNLQDYLGLLQHWYEAVREQALDSWPNVIYYLMGANEWRVSTDWPPPESAPICLYLSSSGELTTHQPVDSGPDCYTYDPRDPTPTVGGSVVSYLYPPGSVDVSAVQERSDVLVYSSRPLAKEMDLAGSLRMILFVSSSARDTDFVARLSDVFPDGRAIQLQSGILRARYREREPLLLEPDRVYRLEIDMWATANRFKMGHQIRIDISSADFPRFDRNTNLGGFPGDSIAAHQTIHHSRLCASRLEFRTLTGLPEFKRGL